MTRPVVVIGGGAAGLLAAYRAASLGAPVLVLEKTRRLGTKILISGGGKCNVTHDGPIEDVLRSFRAEEARFLRPSMYRFSNQDIVRLLSERRLRLYTREDGRMFPVNDTAKGVVSLLEALVKEAGVQVRLESPVVGIRPDLTVQTRAGDIPAGAVVLASGGSSFPGSGTTGDGWIWARDLGHSLVKIRAALAPIDLKQMEGLPASGVALRSIELKARAGGKAVARWRGDLLFTHTGVSGPCALGISRIVAEHLEVGPTDLEVDLAPDHSFEELKELLARHTSKALLKNDFPLGLPKAALDCLLGGLALGDAAWSTLGGKGRSRLIETLKGWRLGGVKGVPLAKGEVAAGGISLAEVDPQTMASARVPGLFLCGEVLDIAGPVGGYNLQAAWSTGWVAGESAAERIQSGG